MMSNANPNSTPSIFSNPLFEEVCFALEGNGRHPEKGVVHTIIAGLLEGDQKSICTEHDVCAHAIRVHAKECNGDCISDKFLLYVDGVFDDIAYSFGGCLVDKTTMKKACEITVQAFVTADKLIGEA